MDADPTSKHTSSKVAELLAVISASKKVLILPHDNPDPDSLASAAALSKLFKHALKKTPIVGLGGIIGRSENHALACTLDIPLVPVEQLFPDFNGAIILVDTQPRRANNSLPNHLTPVAVIDHHPDWGTNATVPFVDLRQTYGATSTIVTEYLEEGEVPIDPQIATALFYGIASETQNLGRETKSADIMASQFLYPYVNKRLLGEIQYPPLPRDYFRLIGYALQNAVVYEDIVVTILEDVFYPDAVAEVADFLLRLDVTRWSACLAPYNDFLYVSVRTDDPSARAGLLLASLLPSGMAGGHGMVAGGKVKTSRRKWKDDAHQIVHNFLLSLGKTNLRAEILMPQSGGKGKEEHLLSSLLAGSTIERT